MLYLFYVLLGETVVSEYKCKCDVRILCWFRVFSVLAVSYRNIALRGRGALLKMRNIHNRRAVYDHADVDIQLLVSGKILV